MKKIILTSCFAICTIANAQELNKASLDSLFIHLNKEKIGAGSVSKVICTDGRIERADNVKDPKLYIEQISEMIERKRKLLLEE